MLGQSQFYHETIRKLVVAFGSMFNDIHLVRKNNAGVITQTMKVPLAYGPKQKFLARLRQDATLDNKVAVTLPRIGFEITGLTYGRKLNQLFQPDYTVTINDNIAMDSKRDIPIILNSINYEDSYEGDFASRRSIIYNLAFTLKFYLYGPVTSSSVIKTVQVDQYADLPDKSPTREQRYTVTPDPTTADADDDFGFNETTSFYEDAKEFNSTTGADE